MCNSLVFLGKLAVLLGRIDAAYHSVYALLYLLELLGSQIAMLCCLHEYVTPQQYEALLHRLLMLQQARQQNCAKILLHLNSLRYGQHILIVCQMKFATGLLVFIAHIIQFPTTSTGCCKEGDCQTYVTGRRIKCIYIFLIRINSRVDLLIPICHTVCLNAETLG